MTSYSPKQTRQRLFAGGDGRAALDVLRTETVLIDLVEQRAVIGQRLKGLL